ncbi:MAG TPA: hypothetical protein QGG47_12090 [Acidobacteriota bacterium]|nr:hypothetical protein [Acidobacteriota bacterium]
MFKDSTTPCVRALCGALTALLLIGSVPTPLVAATPEQSDSEELIVYLIDHQLISRDELTTIQTEIEAVFRSQAGIELRWILDDSPRRALRSGELRFLILASDGTRWFHGPSNVIGLAPHDDVGVGRNCFVFYRQALWFRQQAVLRCREATRARAQAEAAGVEPTAAIEELAPAECGSYLPALAPLVVARAAAHEMVHILLNKLDHSVSGLMRESFDLREWLAGERESFRLLPEEINALQTLFRVDTATPAER